MTLNPASYNMKSAFSHWKLAVKRNQAFFDSYKHHALHKSLHTLSGVLERLRYQNLKGCFWDIKNLSDDLKKNSIASLLIKTSHTSNSSQINSIQHRTTLDLARLDFKQRNLILSKILEPYLNQETIQSAKISMRRFFLDWKV